MASQATGVAPLRRGSAAHVGRPGVDANRGAGSVRVMASNGLWAIALAADVPAELLFLVAIVLVAIGVGLFLRGG